jgi:hypothetical protein
MEPIETRPDRRRWADGRPRAVAHQALPEQEQEEKRCQGDEWDNTDPYRNVEGASRASLRRAHGSNGTNHGDFLSCYHGAPLPLHHPYRHPYRALDKKKAGTLSRPRA